MADNRGENSAVLQVAAPEEENPVSSSAAAPSLSSSPLQPDENNNDNDNGDGDVGCVGEYDCPLCLKLLYVPTTADCGHSFCQRCAYELITSSSSASSSSAATTTTSRQRRQRLRPNCPICRSESLNKWSLLPSITLEKLLRHSFPKEYAKREAEEEENALFSSNNIHNGRKNYRLLNNNNSNNNEWPKQLPLFVLDPMLPGQRMFLHVFELRYRLLIQNAIADHNRKFGMVGIVPVPFHNNTGSNFDNVVTDNTIANQGTEVEITDCRELPDGRFQVEIIGKCAFQIIEKHISDYGYWEATVEPLISSSSTTATATATATAATTTTTNRNNDTVTDDDAEDDQHQQQQQQEEQTDVEVDEINDDNQDGSNDETINQSPVDDNDDDNDSNSSIDELVQIVVSNYLEWENCVRTNLWERHGSQMDEIKRFLGERPTNNDDPDQLALWIAAAINPLPPLLTP